MKKHTETGIIIYNGSCDDGKEVANCCIKCANYNLNKLNEGGCYTLSAWGEKLNTYVGTVNCLNRKSI